MVMSVTAYSVQYTVYSVHSNYWVNDHKTQTFIWRWAPDASGDAARVMWRVMWQVLEPDFVKPFGNMMRWFTTIVNQPEVTAVIGSFSFCTKMAQFDGECINCVFLVAVLVAVL